MSCSGCSNTRRNTHVIVERSCSPPLAVQPAPGSPSPNGRQEAIEHAALGTPARQPASGPARAVLNAHTASGPRAAL